jgi:hypothetical protein
MEGKILKISYVLHKFFTYTVYGELLALKLSTLSYARIG